MFNDTMIYKKIPEISGIFCENKPIIHHAVNVHGVMHHHEAE